MAGYLRKEIPMFDGLNYDKWKEKIKTHFLYMGTWYWTMTQKGNEIVEENKLENAIKLKEIYLSAI